MECLQELAANQPVLLILDLDPLQQSAESLRKVLTELLLRTERLELLLAAREAPVHFAFVFTLGAISSTWCTQGVAAHGAILS